MTNTITARAEVTRLRAELAKAEEALADAQARDDFKAKTQQEQVQIIAAAKLARGEYNA